MMRHYSKIIIFIVALNTSLFSFGFFSKDESKNMIPFGIISINNPGMESGDMYSEETIGFFNELAADIYQSSNDGIIMIRNTKRIEILIRDIFYKYEDKNLLLYPNQDEEDQLLAVSDFYRAKRAKGIRMVQQVALENGVIALAYGEIPRMQFKKIVENGGDHFLFRLNILVVESGAEKNEFIKIHVKNIKTFPEYDPDEFLSNMEQKILKAYDAVMSTISASGVSETTIKEYDQAQNNKVTEDEKENNEDQNSTKADTKQEAEKELEESTNDDW